MLRALSVFGALTVHMYLPAMPDMAHELRTSAPLIQLALTVFVIGLAVGQVLIGRLWDVWGRRCPC
jgi:MFS transporter, DHA1 family, multidrug resistance protein